MEKSTRKDFFQFCSFFLSGLLLCVIGGREDFPANVEQLRPQGVDQSKLCNLFLCKLEKNMKRKCLGANSIFIIVVMFPITVL